MFGKKKPADASPKSSTLVITGDLNMNYQITNNLKFITHDSLFFFYYNMVFYIIY